MSDKLERDIEEVLDNIEDFEWHRRQRRGPSRVRRAWSGFWQSVTDWIGLRLAGFNAGHLMLAGFLLLIVGLVFRGRGLGTWFVLGGVVIFILGLAWNMRSGKRGPTSTTRGGYWRDRYITYDQNRGGRGRRWFRRWRR